MYICEPLSILANRKEPPKTFSSKILANLNGHTSASKYRHTKIDIYFLF